MINPTEQTQIQERDRQITQHLLSNKIIEDTSGKISLCGKWINPERFPSRPVKIKCNNHSCRTCRRKRIEKQQLKHYLHNKEFREIGGHILLFTLTIHHTEKHTLQFLHDRFNTSLTDMKRGRGWKKLKEMTYYNFHYDNIEITNIGSGHHLHDHLTFGYMNDDVSINEIKDELYNTWNHYTRRNGLRTSKKGIDVSYTLYGGHNKGSGEMSVKSIEELEGTKGTLECWESVSWQYENQPNYTHPDKTPEEVGLEIKDLNKIFSKSKRGRIERNMPTPYIPFNQDTYSKDDSDKILDGYNKDKNYKHPDFTKKELRNHIEVSKGNNNFRVFYDKNKWKWIDTPELPFS